MKRLLAISDIHGEYEKLLSVLNQANYDELEDEIVFLGDYIDRGPDSYKVVQHIRGLKVNFPENVILLKGNHEDMACRYISGEIDKRLFYYNGGHKTLESYPNRTDFNLDIHWLNSLPLYHEIDNYLFVHAGIKPNIPIDQQEDDDLLWIRDEFLFRGWQDYPKIIVHGHTPISKTINIKEMHITKRLNIDTGAGKGGVLSLVDLTNEIVYQS